MSAKQPKNTTVANIIGKRAAKELRVDDIVNIGIGIPEMVSRYARKSGMLDMVTLTVESGGIGGFPVWQISLIFMTMAVWMFALWERWK